jgi:hypothetical protein
MEDKLRKDVASLEAQKQDLDTYNQRLIFNSVNSKQIIYYYRGLVDSLRQETLEHCCVYYELPIEPSI